MPPERIDRRRFLQGFGGGLCAYTAGLAGGAYLLRFGTSCEGGGGDGGERGPLNFVFFLIDDLGWTDAGCYGSGYYETPNVDALAGRGVKFTNAYAACPVSSPTRASIMTGKYPARLRITDWIPGEYHTDRKLLRPEFEQELPLEETTIAEALKSAGYVTAHLGKWHLGQAAYFPDKQGFDLNFGGTHQGQPPSYFDPYGISTVPDGPDGEYLTDRLGDEAVNWIEANRDRPFFLYLSHYAVHTPLEAKQEIIDKYAAKPTSGGHKNATYAAMIESVDNTVGQVTAKVSELGLAGRTVVIFMSDNGGLAGVTSNLPLRAGKGTMYEGGIREPMIVLWPGVTAAGTVSDVPVSSVDFFPTICEMAHVEMEPDPTIDGESIVPILRRTGGLGRQSLYWHYPHYHGGGAKPCGAVRRGDYKLITFYEDGRLELYNLADDIGEHVNLAQVLPDEARELRDELFAWLRDTNAQMPLPNTDPSYTGGWTRSDCDLWADYHRHSLVGEGDVRKVVKAYRQQ